MKKLIVAMGLLIAIAVGMTSCIGETRRGNPNPNSQPQPVNQD
ncbi:MAG: hypothetical protein ACOVSW_02890 [Candidatus Kapaibacteriota bacterium]